MSESKYESKTGTIAANAADAYNVLGNLSNINRVSNLIPQDKVQELEADTDTIRFKAGGLAQKIVIRIVDREENKTLKFAIDNLPVQANLWIQFKQIADMDTRIRLTVKADIPLMFRMMLEKKLQQGLDQAVDMLCQFPFATWNQHE